MARRDQQADRIYFKILGFVESTVGKLQFRLLQALTSATPVDTGFARAGWTLGVGTLDLPSRTRPDDLDKARRDAASAYSEQLAKSIRLTAGYRMSMGPVHLINPVVYIRRLNEGWSAQAKARFVDRQVELVVQSFGGRAA